MLWPLSTSGRLQLLTRRSPRPRVGPQQRVQQDILVAAVVEEGAAHGSFEREAAFFRDPPGGGVLGDDDQVDPVFLLGPEEVIDKQLDRLGHVATSCEAVVV
jgi:hypothetical protein